MSYQSIITPEKGTQRVMHQWGDTTDIINTVLYADKLADQYVNPVAVKRLKVANNDFRTARNVWDFVRTSVRYKADRSGHEIVKSPGALFHQYGEGDCKSFSVSVAAILRALGYDNVYYRFTAYKNRPDFSHVYVVLKFADGEIIVDSTTSPFNQEAAYTRKQDYRAAGGKSSAVGYPSVAGVNGDIQNITKGLVTAGILFSLYWFFNND